MATEYTEHTEGKVTAEIQGVKTGCRIKPGKLEEADIIYFRAFRVFRGKGF